MNYRPRGRSGLKVSPLCLGTMNFGPQTTEPDSHAIMDKALELGINFIDTADIYGGVPGEGLTEQIVGRWLDARKNRASIILATKVFNDMNRKGQTDPNLSRGLSAGKIMRCCDGSLQRLKTDYIDLYQMHHVDRACPVDEIWQAMETLTRQGKIRYVGSSNFAAWDIATANQVASHRNFVGLISEQSIYHLDNRMLELEVIPACRHYGLGIIPWSPLGGGLLGGALAKAQVGRRSNPNFEKTLEKKRPQLEKYEALCNDIHQQPATVALAWLLNNPVVTAPIIGPRTMTQLTDSMPAIDLKLTDDTLNKLNEIFPGPGGEAPKAYAW